MPMIFFLLASCYWLIIFLVFLYLQQCCNFTLESILYV
uniref:Uncharacterized protein n=1 Tax=Rhizophora mucronata TaxID=61149 RepID=A0A2P2NBL4_RHIMU